MRDFREFTKGERIKDRLTTIMKTQTKVVIHPECVDAVAELYKAALDNFVKIAEEKEAEDAMQYLFDLLALYMMISEETCKLCSEIIERAK